mgnify:CR=1 FL=1
MKVLPLILALAAAALTRVADASPKAAKQPNIILILADDQGWRIEILSRPKLTAVGGSSQVGGGPAGYYTQREYRELVAYAADRFITVVPEIDMPGHTNAALASYAALNCDGAARSIYTGTDVGFSSLCVERDSTYAFVRDVVRELQSRRAAIACLVIIGLGGLAGWGVSLAGRLDMTAILAVYSVAMLAMLLVQMRLLAHKGVPFRGAYAALPLAAAPLLIHLLPRIP